jgi:hypothetical protein
MLEFRRDNTNTFFEHDVEAIPQCNIQNVKSGIWSEFYVEKMR